ncbi:MAG: CBS domain-containing protein [Bacteroidetes bacterium]|jgi:acetoin utilization protein AcuB|nr:CBS domain-containing protein [Bacteroidota bacterium]MBK7568805.1 CBS domain-containing protein [Bacteroidota bacterium]
MIFKRNASDFMTGAVIVANVHNTFDQVMEFFTTYKIQHLPVADDDRLIGIISINDMLNFMSGIIKEDVSITHFNLNKRFKISEVMTPDPVTVEPDSSQKDVLEILAEGKFQAVPVVKEGIILGIITNKDITRIYNYDATHVLP